MRPDGAYGIVEKDPVNLVITNPGEQVLTVKGEG